MGLTWGLGTSAEAGQSYVVGVEDIPYFPVYSVVHGQYTGAARQIFDAFAKDQGISLTYLPLPVARLDRDFIAGKFDLHFPDNPNWATDVKAKAPIIYSDPVVRYIDGTMVMPSHLGRGQASIATLGIPLGFTPWAWNDKIKQGSVTTVTNSDLVSMVQMALRGRVDGAYASVAVMNYQLDHTLSQPGALVYDPNLPHDANSYMLSSIKHPELIKAFNAWMMGHEALIADIKQKTGAEKGVAP